ncbi:helix-turn-helix domain-containing protein [Lutibacter maritimus]|uniref:Transcriptional regulator, AlpA family n=1 Tax=Lutibacter maritimus TaxID=593133 RepID=A0A1I6SQA0_9FLAO|nr:helix-turn-helix domain-containing protein [Lutibacter maritimus]SFS79174.1 transcriptional regulator, AlpA family [Lutibacter maritimus]
MDYNQLYTNSYNKAFEERERFIYTTLLEAKKALQSYNYTSNKYLKEINTIEIKKFEYLKQYPYSEVTNLFNKRFEIYEENSINNIVNLKILPLLENSNIKLEKTLETIISEIAAHDALLETSRIMTNNYNLYELMYNLNDLSKFKLISYTSDVRNTPLYQKLENKMYPPAKPSKTKINKNHDENDEFLNVKEVAELTNYAVATIYDLKHKGQLPFYKKGAKLQFKKSEIINWLEKGKGITIDDLDEKANDYILKNS